MAAHSVQSSNFPPNLQKLDFQDLLKKTKKDSTSQQPNPTIHPAHTACRPPCGLPLASPSLTLGHQPKTGLQQQAQAVLTPPRQSQSVIFAPLRVFRNALCVPAPLESLLFNGVCLLFLKEILFCFSEKASKKERKNKKK